MNMNIDMIFEYSISLKRLHKVQNKSCCCTQHTHTYTHTRTHSIYHIIYFATELEVLLDFEPKPKRKNKKN